MKNIQKELLLLLLGVCASLNSALPVNLTLSNSAGQNGELKALSDNTTEEFVTISQDDTSYDVQDQDREGTEMDMKATKQIPFMELINKDNNVDTAGYNLDTSSVIGNDLMIVETGEVDVQVQDQYETKESNNDRQNGNARKSTLLEDYGSDFIVRIQQTETDHFDITTGPPDDKQNIDNTTIPPLLCWEMSCPDCLPHESASRCLARGFLTVTVRSVIFGVCILLFFACVVVVNSKKKGTGAQGRCEENVSLSKGDRAVPIDKT